MSDGETGLSGPGSPAEPDHKVPAAVPAPSSQTPPHQRTTRPARRQVALVWGAVISAGSAIYLLWQWAHHKPITGWDLVFTLGGLSVGGWLILGALAVGAAAIFLFLAWVGVALSAIAGLFAIFVPMTFSYAALFIHPPTAPLDSACTASPAVWVVHGLHPAACSGIAYPRLGIAALSAIVIAIMRAVGSK